MAYSFSRMVGKEIFTRTQKTLSYDINLQVDKINVVERLFDLLFLLFYSDTNS